MADNIAQLTDLRNIEDFLIIPESQNVDLTNLWVMDTDTPGLINVSVTEMEAAWSESHIADQSINANLNNTDIYDDSLNIPDNTESNTEEIERYLLAPTSSTKPAAKKRKRAKANPVRVNTTRKRCKESIPLFEARLTELSEETLEVEKELQLKHSNLAGHHGKKFDVKILRFSREQEKSAIAAKLEEIKDAYPSKRKCRTQKQAGYLEFLSESYLPVREKYLNILKTELCELDQELEKNLKK